MKCVNTGPGKGPDTGVYCNIQGHARLMFRPPLECATSHRQHTFLYIVFVFKWMHYTISTISNIKEIINSKTQVSYVIAAHLGHTIINYVPGRTQMGAETAYNQFGSVSKLYTSSVTCVIHKMADSRFQIGHFDGCWDSLFAVSKQFSTTYLSEIRRDER